MSASQVPTIDVAGPAPRESAVASWREVHESTLPALMAQAEEQLSQFTAVLNAAPSAHFTEAGAEQAAAALEASARLCDQAKGVVEESAGVAILAGAAAQRAHREWAQQWADRAAAIAYFRVAVTQLLKLGAKNDRYRAIELARTEALQNGKAAVEHLREAQKAMPKLIRFFQAVQVFDDACAQQRRAVQDARDVLDAEELGRLEAVCFAEQQEYRLSLSVPGGDHLVCDVALLPSLAGALGDPSAAYVPANPARSLTIDVHGKVFDPSRFGMEEPEQAAADARAREEAERSLPENIQEDDEGRRWSVHRAGGVEQRRLLVPGDKYYRTPESSAGSLGGVAAQGGEH